MTHFLSEIIFVLALASIAIGAGLIYLPAGLIVGGLLAAATVVLVMLDAQREAPRDRR